MATMLLSRRAISPPALSMNVIHSFPLPLVGSSRSTWSAMLKPPVSTSTVRSWLPTAYRIVMLLLKDAMASRAAASLWFLMIFSLF